MLILGRKVNEKILIGDEITIMVVGINRDGKVSLGISAPADVRVDREEYRAMRTEREKRIT